MNRQLNNESGLTLVELLAVFVVLAIFSTIAYAVFIQGIKAYDRTKVEADLRDEADIIMAELITDMYTLKDSDILREYLPEENSNNYYFRLIDGTITGIYDGQVYIRDKKTSALQTGKIVLEESSKISVVSRKDGLYKIELTLSYVEKDRNQTITTESEIGIIKDY